MAERSRLLALILFAVSFLFSPLALTLSLRWGKRGDEERI
jgi:hypothetical protein